MNHPENDTDPEAFQKWLDEYPRGALGVDLSEALAEVVFATRAHGKPSSFALKVKITPGNTDLGDLLVSADVETKPAKPDVPKHTFFPTEDGGLSRSDPNQPVIPGMEPR